MSREIRWLVEAKSPLEEVNDKENKKSSKISQSYIAYKRANNLSEKDAAVSDALNTITNTDAGEKLRKSLGLGFLSRFMDAFKWDSLTVDNLFIRLLQRLFGGYKDSEVVRKILSGERPTADRDMKSKINQSKVNDNDQSQSEPQDIELNANPGDLTTSVNNESLNEASRSKQRKRAMALKNRTTTTTSKNAVANPQLSIKARTVKDIEDKNQNQEATSQEPEQALDQQTNKEMNTDEAKILDMSPRDMFIVLYNGYLNHLYTYEDLVNIDNDTKDNSTLTSKDGSEYTIAKSLKDIIVKCQDDENAFTQKDSSNDTYTSSETRPVKDLKDKIIDAAKKLSNAEKYEVVKAIQQQ